MGKSTKAKPKPKPKPVLATVMTPERARIDEFEDRDAPFMAGDRTDARRIQVKGRRSRLCRFHADGWIGDAGFAALKRYEELMENAGYGHARSCLDMSPTGNDSSGATDAIAIARDILSRTRNAVVLATSTYALMLLDAMLWPDAVHAHETAREVAARLIGGSRVHREAEAKRLVGLVSDAMVSVMANTTAAV